MQSDVIIIDEKVFKEGFKERFFWFGMMQPLSTEEENVYIEGGEVNIKIPVNLN